MARNTLFLELAFPSPLEEPWLASFDSLVEGLDAQVFSAVTDRNLFITGGGTINFDLATETLSWTDPIKLTNFVTGFFQEIPAGNVTLTDGQFLFSIVSRGLEDVTSTITLEAQTESKLLNRPRGELHVDVVVAARFGDNIVFRNGAILPPDFPFAILITSPIVGRRAFVNGEFIQNQHLNDVLIGTPDGTRDTFGICRNPDQCLFAVYLDGIRQLPGTDFILQGCHKAEFTPAPAVSTVLVLDLYEPAVVFQGVWQEANIWGECPEGDIDGVNTTFTTCLAQESGTLRVYQDGLRMKLGTDYTITDSTTFDFTTAPSGGASIVVDYIIDRSRVSEFIGQFVFNEIPTKNSATEFEVANDFQVSTPQVYKNGLRMKLGTDYVEGPGDTKITFSVPTFVPDVVVIDYMKKIT